jgi:hypothetical protein
VIAANIVWRVQHNPADDRLYRDCPDLVEQVTEPIRDRHPEQLEYKQHQRKAD